MTTVALEPPVAAPAQAPRPSPVGRLASVDVLRGFIMMTLALQGYFPGIAAAHPGNPVFGFLGRQFSHVDWAGIAYWDTIMPTFAFLVGVSMTFSWHARRGRGESSATLGRHVLQRSFIFIALGVLLVSAHSERTIWTLGELLAQFGLAYPIAYLLVGRNTRSQALGITAILVIAWVAFALFPVPGPTYDYGAIGASGATPQYTGFFAHWNDLTNLANAFDRWFLNLFPQPTPFLANYHYGPTLVAVPLAATMGLGIMVGELLRSPRTTADKAMALVKGGAGLLAAGLVMGFTLCPIVKYLWTPSYVLVAGALAFWYLALTIWVVDLRGWRRGAFMFTVVGRNSLAMYLMLRLLKEPVRATVATHAWFLQDMPLYWTFEFFAVVVVLWGICYWMYRRKLFISV